MKFPHPVLLTGCDGLLGFDLARVFRQFMGHNQVIALNRPLFDITREEKAFDIINEFRPQIVINAAGFTHVDRAETERDRAYAVNVDGPAILSRACERFEIPFVHFSTDQVFDGTGTRPWSEEDRPNPINYYAKTKLFGEREVLKWEKSLVVRVQWLYGTLKNRFTGLKYQNTFSPFSDQRGAPTWTKDVGEILAFMIKRELSGIYHYSYDDSASWAEVYRFVKEQLRYHVALDPRPTAQANLPAPRPCNAILSNEKLKNALEVPTLGQWQKSLVEFFKEMKMLPASSLGSR